MTAQPGYYRFPTIAQDMVVFVSEDDLWTVSAQGGIARRLTANKGRATSPALSPDGQWLAFVGHEDGESEVYVMPAQGGPATRVTYFGYGLRVLGWTVDSERVIFSSNAKQPFFRQYEAFTIARTGGLPAQLPVGLMTSLDLNRTDPRRIVISRHGQDPATWKRYRGGRAGDLWIDAQGDGQFSRLLAEVKGNLANPMWIGERIYFISDHEGYGNIYSCTPAGDELTRHTDHETYFARNPHTDGQRIVYHAGGDLYVFDPAQDEPPRRIEIEYYSPRIQAQRKFVLAANYLQDYAVHPNGQQIALVSRGKPFNMPAWAGAVLQHGDAQGTRYRLIDWLSDGQRLIMISDAVGEERLEVHSSSRPTILGRLEADVGRPHLLAVSPSKQEDALVLANHRYELLLVGSDRTVHVLDRSDWGRIYGVNWSPDGQWVVYSLPTLSTTSAIKLCHIPSLECHYLTSPGNFIDFAPCFDPEGNYIYFLSNREFNPVSDAHYFDWGFVAETRPYLITLRQDVPNPFIATPEQGQPNKQQGRGYPYGSDDPPSEADDQPLDDAAEGSADEQKAQNEADAAPKNEKPDKENGDKQLVIDLDGIQRRVTVFPVAEGWYRGLAGLPKGKILFTYYHLENALIKNVDDPPKGGTLQTYELKERKFEYIAGEVYSFDVSRDYQYVAYWAKGRKLRVLKLGDKPDGSKGFNKRNGWIDLKRAKVAINPPEEWAQMLREVWRLQRDQFWTEDMSQIDWLAVYDRYEALVPRVGSRSEFSDLVWEMQGELGTSHAYESGGDYLGQPRNPQGFLGADFAYDAESGGYRITHIVDGDLWLDKGSSPLNRLGINISVGDIVLAINGQPLSETVSPSHLLVNMSKTEVELTVVVPDEPDAEDEPLENAEPVEASETEETATIDNEEHSSPETVPADPQDDSSAEQETESAEGDAETESDEIRVRTVLVTTVANERPARYRDWVERNRQYVHDQTDGKLGYLHIPDMGTHGFAEFHRYYLSEADRIGLIVDVRYNRGGSVSQLLLSKLAQRRIGYDQPRHGKPEAYPSHSVIGPMIVLANENSASDGDLFSHAFKLLKLGKMVGKRTWGGVIGIWPRHNLVDGGQTTQPEFSFWFEDVGWSVENYGTDPDIEVEFRPQDYVAGVDPQLDRAISELFDEVTANPPQVPDFGERPNLAPPTLLKR